MTTGVTTACPYCNAFVPVPPDAAAGRRLLCPRCSETFAYLPRDGVPASRPAETFTAETQSSVTDESGASAPPATDSFRTKVQLVTRILLGIAAVLVFVCAAYVNSLVSNGAPVDVATIASVAVPVATILAVVSGVAFLWLWYFRTRRSNAATSLFIAGNMLLIGSLTLAVALATQHFRRENDAGLRGRAKRSPVAGQSLPQTPISVTPAHLDALGYLPAKIDLIAGVHVAELLDGPAGKRLLEEPIKVGDSELRIADLAGKIGFTAQQLDHFVVAMRTDEPLSILAVVRTRETYDAAKIREILKARSLPGKPSGRTLYQVTVPGNNLTPLLWCADDRTLLIGLSRETLESATLAGERKTDPLVSEVRDVLSDRIRPVAQLWAVGYAADWSKTAPGLLLSRLPDEWQRRLISIRTFGIWADVDAKSVTLNAAARCDNAKTAEQLLNWLAKRGNSKNPPTLARDDNWLSIQSKTDLDSFRGMLAP